MKQTSIATEFVECIPDSIGQGILYISIPYATAVHLCVCGCSREVVTPFSPSDWKLIFDGETVSLMPSIGNWSFPCRSHYFIKQNKIEVAGRMSQLAIENNRKYDRQLKLERYSKVEESLYEDKKNLEESVILLPSNKVSLYARVLSFFKN